MQVKTNVKAGVTVHDIPITSTVNSRILLP